MDLDSVSVYKHAKKKELDQYPAILTSCLVNNPCIQPGLVIVLVDTHSLRERPGVCNCFSFKRCFLAFCFLKARLHRRFLSQQLDAIFVALKLQLQDRRCKLGRICRRDIADVSKCLKLDAILLR